MVMSLRDPGYLSGGDPYAPDPWADIREPSAVAQGSVGGLGGFGGMSGGFFNNPVLDALSMSLMSSPRNAPLANFGQMMNSVTDNRRQQEMFALKKQEFADEKAQKNKTLEYLRAKFPDVAGMVDAGLPVRDAFDLVAGSKKQQALMNAGDGQIYDPNTGTWLSNPNAVLKVEPPKIVELYDETTGQPYKAQFNPETNEYERLGGVKARSGMSLRTNADGTVELQQGDLGGMPKLSEAEGRNSGFYGRSVESQKILNEVEQEGTKLGNKATDQIPVFGNFARSEDAQRYDQARRDFVNAVLRRESGAVISPEEFKNAENQYFPQPGDGPAVIEQKRKNRETTIQGLKISAGQGANFALPDDAADPAAPTKRLRFNQATGELE